MSQRTTSLFLEMHARANPSEDSTDFDRYPVHFVVAHRKVSKKLREELNCQKAILTAMVSIAYAYARNAATTKGRPGAILDSTSWKTAMNHLPAMMARSIQEQTLTRTSPRRFLSETLLDSTLEFSGAANQTPADAQRHLAENEARYRSPSLLILIMLEPSGSRDKGIQSSVRIAEARFSFGNTAELTVESTIARYDLDYERYLKDRTDIDSLLAAAPSEPIDSSSNFLEFQLRDS